MIKKIKESLANFEVRLVPYGWEHPVGEDLDFKPLIDIGYDLIAQDWLDNCIQWAKGIHPDQDADSCRYYWDWEGPPPEKDYFRPAWPESIMTCLQIYKSEERIPVSPVFKAPLEMELWIMERWRVSENEAKKFVSENPGPSLMMLAMPELKKEYREVFQIY